VREAKDVDMVNVWTIVVIARPTMAVGRRHLKHPDLKDKDSPMTRHAWFPLSARMGLLAALALPMTNGLAATTGRIPSKGLVAHWDFDDSSKPLVRDFAGGHDAQVHGQVRAAPGVFGKSLRFSGASSYLAAPDAPDLSFVDAIGRQLLAVLRFEHLSSCLLQRSRYLYLLLSFFIAVSDE